MYIKHSKILSFTSNDEKVSAPQDAINIKNAIKPTNLLLEIFASLESISLKKLIFTP
jgi:hypothetical protein